MGGRSGTGNRNSIVERPIDTQDKTVELYGVTYTEKQIEERIAEDDAKIREYQDQLLGLKDNSKQSRNIHSKLRARQSDLAAFTAAKKRLK